VFDTTTVDANSKEFIGATFDGRYIYFVPSLLSGQVTRYDTTASFTSASSYAVFDTTTVDANSKGFWGAVFDGRYVYFAPNTNGQITRYDTSGSFTDSSSYAVFDTTTVDANSKGFHGAVFDGRYIYLVPYNNGAAYVGQITRYDTTASFTSVSSYTVFDTETVHTNSKGFQGATFDGRYIYFVPYYTGAAYAGQITRYDTTASFTSASSYAVFDTEKVNSNSKGLNGAVFDGRYVYFVPSQDGPGSHVARYDTTGSFTATSSYRFFDVSTVDADSKGLAGATFDGRYIYFVPFNNNTIYFGKVSIYDVTGSFTDTSAWSVFDTATVNSNSKGFWYTVFDGQYVYLVPNFNGSTFGQVTRIKAYTPSSIDVLASRFGASTEFYIDAQGRLGVGTTTPQAMLQVAGTAGPNLLFTETGAGVDLKHWYASTTAGDLTFGILNDTLTALTERLRITNAGNLGIGTTSPWGQLSIEQLSGGLFDPVFVVADTGTTTPHLFVSQHGRVGIGTTTPATKTQVTDTGTSTIYLDSSGASTYGRIIIEGKNGCLEISVDAAATGIDTKSVSCPH